MKITRGKAKTDAPDPALPPLTTETPAGDPPRATRSRLVAPRAPSSAKNHTRVLLGVADGKIEWDKMSAEARKQFEDLFKDPEFLQQFGLTGKSNAFDPDQVKYIYDAISTMYQTVTSFFLKWPAEAVAMLAYTPAQKDILADPTAKLLNKVAPAFLMKHQEVLVWGAVFAAVTQQNFKSAQDKADELVKKPRPIARVAPGDLPAPIPQPGHIPIPGNGSGISAVV